MKIIITGVGIISAIGNNAQEVLASLRHEKSGVAEMQFLPTVHNDLPAGEVKLSNAQLKELIGVPADKEVSRTTLMGAYAINQALADAGIDASGNKRIAIVNGTTVGGMDITERYFAR